MLKVNVEGLEKVFDDLTTFTSKMQRRGLSQSMRQGMNVVRDAARQKAKPLDDPDTTDVIWKNIQTQTGSRRKARRAGADALMQVGVRGGARFNADSPYPTHWRFVEFGTSYVRAQPFMRPAMAENVQQATDKTAAHLRKVVDRIARTGK